MSGGVGEEGEEGSGRKGGEGVVERSVVLVTTHHILLVLV